MTKIEHYNSSKGKNDHQKSPPSINNSHETTPESDLASKHRKENKEPKRFIGGLFTLDNLIQIGLLIANVIMVIVLICTSIMQGEYTRESLDLADTSNGITRESLELSENTARNQLRAYINAEIISPKGIERFNNRFAIKFGLVNYGQTPAYWANISGQIQKLEYPEPCPKGTKYDGSANLNSNWLVFPNSNVMPTSTGWIYSDSTMGNIKEKDIRPMLSTNFRIYFFARIYYRDIFERDRATYICRFIDSVACKEDGSISRVHWADYKEHNSFDR